MTRGARAWTATGDTYVPIDTPPEVAGIKAGLLVLPTPRPVPAHLLAPIMNCAAYASAVWVGSVIIQAGPRARDRKELKPADHGVDAFVLLQEVAFDATVTYADALVRAKTPSAAARLGLALGALLHRQMLELVFGLFREAGIAALERQMRGGQTAAKTRVKKKLQPWQVDALKLASYYDESRADAARGISAKLGKDKTQVYNFLSRAEPKGRRR